MLNILLSNLFTLPILFFLIGIFLSLIRINWLLTLKLHSFLTYFLLFSIGLKGGGSFIEHSSCHFFLLLAVMLVWGLIQPFISYCLLKKWTKIDSATAVAIAACFGSVSLMTFAAGAAFLEKLSISYQGFIIPILAMMEIPAIFSGLFIAKWQRQVGSHNIKNLWTHTLFNKAIVTIFLGMGVGIICSHWEYSHLSSGILIAFKPSLYVFLFNMGLLIGKKRKDLSQFSWSLSLFGCYMPLIGGLFGILLSYLFQLDVGTGTLLAILSASASYIAVPAAMKIALPEAKEAIYLPLSLAVAFPFNILIGIPLYYFLALHVLI